jgi:hypothetical protein
MLLFIVIALILYALFSRPHRRVPGRAIRATSAGGQASQASQVGGATMTASANRADAAGTQPAAEEPDSSMGASE